MFFLVRMFFIYRSAETCFIHVSNMSLDSIRGLNMCQTCLGVSAKRFFAKHQHNMFPEETCNDLKHVTIILKRLLNITFYSVNMRSSCSAELHNRAACCYHMFEL